MAIVPADQLTTHTGSAYENERTGRFEAERGDHFRRGRIVRRHVGRRKQCSPSDISHSS